MESIKKKLVVISPLIGIIGILIVVSFADGSDPFSRKVSSEVILGQRVAVWLFVWYLFFSAVMIAFKNFSISSIGLISLNLILIAGFAVELFVLTELRNQLPLMNFYQSYFRILILDLIIMFLIGWFSKDHLSELLNDRKK